MTGVTQRLQKAGAVVASSVLVVTVAGAAHAIDLHVQPPALELEVLSPSVDLRAINAEAPIIRSFENFTLDAAATITDVHWRGLRLPPDLLPTELLGFTITFWSNLDGLPDAPLKVFDIAGNAGETFVDTALLGGGENLTLPVRINDYSVPELGDGGFAVAAGETYWISVVARIDAELPEVVPLGGVSRPAQEFDGEFSGLLLLFSYLWHGGTGGDGQFAVDLTVFDGELELMDGDLAFTLTGANGNGVAPIPEPSTVVLIGAGMLALGLLARRRARR